MCLIVIFHCKMNFCFAFSFLIALLQNAGKLQTISMVQYDVSYYIYGLA
jgi:hypothetical protein